MTKLFQFVPEIQHAALEINDHQVISRAMEQSFGNLIFEGFLPSFKISNMVWFQHKFLSILWLSVHLRYCHSKDKTGLIRENYTLFLAAKSATHH